MKKTIGDIFPIKCNYELRYHYSWCCFHCSMHFWLLPHRCCPQLWLLLTLTASWLLKFEYFLVSPPSCCCKFWCCRFIFSFLVSHHWPLTVLFRPCWATPPASTAVAVTRICLLLFFCSCAVCCICHWLLTMKWRLLSTLATTAPRCCCCQLNDFAKSNP